MKRKVIRQGHNTLTITLPQQWTEKYSVKAGDELSIDEIQQKLVIAAESKHAQRSIEIDIPAGARFFKRYLFSPYAQGYDTIRVIFHDKETLERVHETLNQLIGFEITEQGEHYVVAANVASGIESEFPVMYRRLLHVVIDMTQSLADIIEKKEWERLPSIIAMEILANRLYTFCRRMINKLANEQCQITSMYRINCHHEEITDAVRDICEVIGGMKVDSRVPALLRKMVDVLKLIQIMEGKKDIATFRKLADADKTITKELKELGRKLPASHMQVYASLMCMRSSINAISVELWQ